MALSAPQQQSGKAYGVMQAIQNFSPAVTSNVVGGKGFINVEPFFVFLVSVTLIVSMLLMTQDHSREGTLNSSASKSKRLEALTK